MLNDGLAHREGDRKRGALCVAVRLGARMTEEKRVLRFKWMKSAPF